MTLLALFTIAAPAASSRKAPSARARAGRGHSQDWAYALVIQPDGKIVAAGRSARGRWRVALARYTTAGKLDPSFGRGGKVLSDFGPGSYADSLALQRDGKLVAAGRAGSTPTSFVISRYMRGGRLDASFGSGGFVVTRFRSRKRLHAWATGLAIQRDEKLVVAGGVSDIDAYSRFAVARYEGSGKLDRTFGTGGTRVLGGDGTSSAVAIQPDRKIIALGTSVPGERAVVALVRLTTRGQLDASFGRGGKTVTDFGSWSQGLAVAIQPDSKIVAAGASGFSDFALARFTRDGKLDTSFGSSGKVVTNFGCISWYPRCERLSEDGSRAVAIQPDGRIVAAGWSDVLGGSGEKFCCIANFALARYTVDGKLDGTFGNGGLVVTPFQGGHAIIQAIALQPDGKIVVAGGGAGYFALARYTQQGQLDATFGRGGKVTTNFT